MLSISMRVESVTWQFKFDLAEWFPLPAAPWNYRESVVSVLYDGEQNIPGLGLEDLSGKLWCVNFKYDV